MMPLHLNATKPLIFSCYSVLSLFILSPNVDEMDTPNVRYVIHKGRVIQQQPPTVAKLLESDAT